MSKHLPAAVLCCPAYPLQPAPATGDLASLSWPSWPPRPRLWERLCLESLPYSSGPLPGPPCALPCRPSAPPRGSPPGPKPGSPTRGLFYVDPLAPAPSLLPPKPQASDIKVVSPHPPASGNISPLASSANHTGSGAAIAHAQKISTHYDAQLRLHVLMIFYLTSIISPSKLMAPPPQKLPSIYAASTLPFPGSLVPVVTSACGACTRKPRLPSG